MLKESSFLPFYLSSPLYLPNPDGSVAIDQFEAYCVVRDLSPQYDAAEIMRLGLHRTAKGRFEVEEPRTILPPESRYIDDMATVVIRRPDGTCKAIRFLSGATRADIPKAVEIFAAYTGEAMSFDECAFTEDGECRDDEDFEVGAEDKEVQSVDEIAVQALDISQRVLAEGHKPTGPRPGSQKRRNTKESLSTAPLY